MKSDFWLDKDAELTVRELKQYIQNLPDEAVVRLSNGHAVWRVTDIEQDVEYGDVKDHGHIILTGAHMPK